MIRSPRRRARRASRRQGFTFVEALIALAVVGLTTVAFASILGGAGSSGESSKARVVSLSLAQSILEEALRLPYASLAIGVVEDASLAGYPGASSRVEIAQASPSTKSIAVAISTADGDVRLVGFAGDYEKALGGGGGGDDDDDDDDSGGGEDDKDKDKDGYLGDNDNGDGNDPDEDKGQPGDKGGIDGKDDKDKGKGKG